MHTAVARTHRHALKQPNVELDLVPLDGGAHDLDKGQGDLGVPLLGRLEDEVVEGLADLCKGKRRGGVSGVSSATPTRAVSSSSALALVFWP